MVPDARRTLMKRSVRLSVLASPEEDAERCHAEHNERENLARVHLTSLYPRRYRRHAIAPHVAKPEAAMRSVEGSGTGADAMETVADGPTTPFEYPSSPTTSNDALVAPGLLRRLRLVRLTII